MRAVVLEVSEAELRERRLRGADRWDEMWEGVLHMAPAPANEHQRMLDRLIVFLVPRLEQTGRGTLRSGINVFNETSAKENYRIPDLSFVATGRERLFAADGIRGGGPDAVIEIRSPNDETYDKLPFFAALGVREVVVIDRDTKLPEVFRLAGDRYHIAASGDGWLTSQVLGLRFKATGDTPPRLIVEDAADPTARAEI